MQPFTDTVWQTAQHWHLWRVSGQNPNQRAGMARRLKQGECSPPSSFGFMHTRLRKGEGVAGRKVRPHPRAPLPPRSVTSRPIMAAEVAGLQGQAL